MCSFVCDAVGTVLHTLPEGNAICGVTSLDNLLYALRLKSSEQIEVYDTQSYRLQRCLTVQGLGGMTDEFVLIMCAFIFLAVMTNVYIE